MQTTMDDQNVYKHFNEFLTGFLIRRSEGTLTDEDFDEKQLDYISPHLETILPTLSLPQVIRIQTYFNEALSFHIKEDLGQNTSTSIQKPNASSSPSYNSEVQPFKRAKIIEADTQKEISQEETPYEGFTFNQRATSGMMQSTPLSMPAAENEMGIYIHQPEYTSVLEDPFINDILTQVNVSPIPQEVGNQPILSNPSVNTFMQPDSSWIRNIEDQEHPFLHNFAHLFETAKKKTHHQLRKKNSFRQQFNAVEIELPTPKAKRKRIAFEILCCSLPKNVNQGAEESFLYFPLLPSGMRNLIKMATGSDHTRKEQSSIPMEKIMNLSNVIRAYASEMQTSVDLPAQGSFLPSPYTTQNLLRTSQLQQFTPIRGEGSSQFPGLEMEQIHFQSRSVIREQQQSLLPIPERDSLLPRLTGSLDEVVPFRKSLASISQLPENILASQLDMADDINLASIAENVGEINFEPQTSIHIGSPNVLPAFMEQHELSVQNENIVQNNIPPSLENQVDNAQTNWFDILRPRLDIVYPMEGEEGRKRKKNRKRNIKRDPPLRPNVEIEDTPASVSLALPVIPDDLSEQITQYPVASSFTQSVHGLRAYITLLKEGVRNPERTWEHFDPFLFTENDDFEMYTHIFKRVVREDYVAMDTLHGEGTSRLNAARGFRLLLELQTMGLIEILATGTRIDRFKYIPPK